MGMLLIPTIACATICVNVDEGVVHLTWDKNPEEDLAGYNLYRSIDGGPYEEINTLLIGIEEYTDSNIPAGEVTLNYKLQAQDLCGNVSFLSVESEDVRSDTIPPSTPGSAPKVSVGQ